MPDFLVTLTGEAEVVAEVRITADTADQAGDIAVAKWRELRWEVVNHPNKSALFTPCVDECV